MSINYVACVILKGKTGEEKSVRICLKKALFSVRIYLNYARNEFC